MWSATIAIPLLAPSTSTSAIPAALLCACEAARLIEATTWAALELEPVVVVDDTPPLTELFTGALGWLGEEPLDSSSTTAATIAATATSPSRIIPPTRELGGFCAGAKVGSLVAGGAAMGCAAR